MDISVRDPWKFSWIPILILNPTEKAFIHLNVPEYKPQALFFIQFSLNIHQKKKSKNHAEKEKNNKYKSEVMVDKEALNEPVDKLMLLLLLQT